MAVNILRVLFILLYADLFTASFAREEHFRRVYKGAIIIGLRNQSTTSWSDTAGRWGGGGGSGLVEVDCPCWISTQLYAWQLPKSSLSSTVAGNPKKWNIRILIVIRCFISDGGNGRAVLDGISYRLEKLDNIQSSISAMQKKWKHFLRELVKWRKVKNFFLRQ